MADRKPEGCTVSEFLAETDPSRLLLPGLSERARQRRPRGLASSRFRAIAWSAALVLLGAVGAAAGASEDVSKEQMQGLDEQVQEIKSDVLGIAQELSRLEEKLLFPSNTQVAVFVALAEGETFRLDAVEIQIDGEPVARHIYSFKELEALQKGGVQRLYTGNVSVGDHQLQVSVAGKLESGRDLAETRSFAFRKEVEPKLVGITLGEQKGGDGPIALGEW